MTGSGIAAPRRLAVCIVLLLCSFLTALGNADAGERLLQAHGFKMAGDERYTRIVMHFDVAPEINWFLLRGPHRLVLDMPSTAFSFDPAELAPRGLISKVQYGASSATQARIVLETLGPFSVDAVDVLENETSEGFRLIIELRAASDEAFETAMLARLDKPTGGDAMRTPDEPRPKKRFTVAIDAGHGGADGGARGTNGTSEKTITLIFALELAKKLKETGGYEVVLTRDRDRFMRLDERVRLARQKSADLFVSIHADAISLRSVRGATVYTVSDKASDAKAAATAARENLADQIAGHVVPEEKDEVEDILVDLIRRETHAFSLRFADNLVDELSQTTLMVTNPHRYAGFRVLRAPDIPSVLVELGYLSNPRDEEQMRDPEWRAKTADAIVSAITLFAKAMMGPDG